MSNGFIRSKLKQSAFLADLLSKISSIKSGKPNAFNVECNGQRFFGEKMGAVVAAVLASKVIQDLTFTSVITGPDGNLISVAYTAGATAGAEVVTVVGKAISVQIEDGVSTAAQIKAAVEAKAEAVALVSVTVSGTGSNAQAVQVATFLLNGANSYFNYISDLTSDPTKITFTYSGSNYEVLLSDIKIIKRLRCRKYLAKVSQVTVV